MAIETRKLLRASQSAFANFIGANVKTVQAWEQGGNPVSGVSARFLDEIRHNPDYWRQRFKEVIRLT